MQRAEASISRRKCQPNLSEPLLSLSIIARPTRFRALHSTWPLIALSKIPKGKRYLSLITTRLSTIKRSRTNISACWWVLTRELDLRPSSFLNFAEWLVWHLHSLTILELCERSSNWLTLMLQPKWKSAWNCSVLFKRTSSVLSWWRTCMSSLPKILSRSRLTNSQLGRC